TFTSGWAAAKSDRRGNSRLQGSHHEAHRLRRTGRPSSARWAARSNSDPSNAVTTNVGAGAPTSATSEPPLRINHATRAPIPTRATNNAVRSPPDSPARSVASGAPERASVSVISLALRHPPEHVAEDPAVAAIPPRDGGLGPGEGAAAGPGT